MNLQVFDHFTRTWGGMDLRDDVRRIEIPTLVLGGRDDPMTPHECSTEIFELLPQGTGQLEILDRCGHGSFRDRPEETERILRAFLADQ